jgi:hypothetical protein
MYKHYLYDILRGFWSGSGDSKLQEIISDPTTCRYVRDVSENSFEQVISEWLKSANSKATLTNVSAETKLFLNYLLRISANPAEVAKTEYDIEHCVPKKVLQDFFVKKNTPVPISATCNLVDIPKAENRSKGDMTYYQKQDKDACTYSLNEDALDVLCYPRKKELELVKSVETLTADNYASFLSDREKFITQRFVKNLYK